MVEQLTCNQQAVGSSPMSGFSTSDADTLFFILCVSEAAISETPSHKLEWWNGRRYGLKIR